MQREICNCNKPEAINIDNPKQSQVALCKNCLHLIYYQAERLNPAWEHFVQYYKPGSFSITSPNCSAPLDGDSNE